MRTGTDALGGEKPSLGEDRRRHAVDQQGQPACSVPVQTIVNLQTRVRDDQRKEMAIVGHGPLLLGQTLGEAGELMAFDFAQDDLLVDVRQGIVVDQNERRIGAYGEGVEENVVVGVVAAEGAGEKGELVSFEFVALLVKEIDRMHRALTAQEMDAVLFELAVRERRVEFQAGVEVLLERAMREIEEARAKQHAGVVMMREDGMMQNGTIDVGRMDVIDLQADGVVGEGEIGQTRRRVREKIDV